MTRKRRRKKTAPPTVCREPGCHAKIGWIPGLKFPFNPGGINIRLWAEPKEIEGFTLDGDKVWGRKVLDPEAPGKKIVKLWTRHFCEKKPAPPPPPATDARWGADLAIPEDQ